MGTATLLAWMLLETTVTTAASPRGPEEARKAILNAGFLDDKTSLGRALGRDRSPAAKQVLLQLLEDDNYWNRLAAVEGLLVRAEPDTDRALVDRMVSDHMVAAEIKSGLTDRPAKNPQVLREAYAATNDARGRQTILEVMGTCQDVDTTAFLEKLVARRGDPHREAALRALGETGGAAVRATVVKYIDDKGLRPHVLGYLLRHGTEADLPTFLKVLDGREPTANALVAFAAVARWGDAATVERVLLEALESPEDPHVHGAINALGEARSERLVAPLCRVVLRGGSQDTRMAAAGMVARQRSRASVPCLVSVLKERYQPSAREPLDAIPAFITVGLSTLFQGLSEKWNEEDFRGRRTVIVSALRALTGQDHGDSYERWQEWAVLQGHTVDGVNLVQHLFSPRPSRRQAAAQAALKILGHKTAKDFAQKNGLARTPEGTELSVVLAKALVEKGLLVDEEE